MVNINKLMAQAQALQQKMAEDMEALRVEASSGGGVVSVTMNGKKDLLSLTIKKEAVDPDDLEMLEDLVKAAVNEAARRVDEELQNQLGGMMPPGLGFPRG
jgi:DNA-binding YbaB/EbfC family protein